MGCCGTGCFFQDARPEIEATALKLTGGKNFQFSFNNRADFHSGTFRCVDRLQCANALNWDAMHYLLVSAMAASPRLGVTAKQCKILLCPRALNCRLCTLWGDVQFRSGDAAEISPPQVKWLPVNFYWGWFKRESVPEVGGSR